MAETTKKTTHKRAKGRTINGQPHRRRTGRAGAREKKPLGRQKAAQAEAQKRKKTTVPRKRPRAGAAGNAQRAESGKYGLDRLTGAVDTVLDKKRCKKIASSLADEVEKGNASSAKVFIMLADKAKKESEMETNQKRNREIVRGIYSQPEYKEPANEDGQLEKPVPAVIETIHAVAED